ncbi:hypothetical protein Tco_0147233, partial [Tanacetum coccineum]
LTSSAALTSLGGTTVFGCENDASIQKSNGLATLEKEMETRVSNKTSPCETVSRFPITRKCVSTTSTTTSTVYKSDGKIMPHNKALPKDCYKVSIDKSLVDAAFIPDVASNGCTTVLDAVGGFVAWPKNQVVFYPKVTPPKVPKKTPFTN